jgi:hypothetical protein
MQSCPMRQVAAVPAADDGAMRCSDRRRPQPIWTIPHPHTQFHGRGRRLRV